MSDDSTDTVEPNPEATPDVSIEEILAIARAEAEAETPDAPPAKPKRTRKTTPSRSGSRKRNLTEPLTDMYVTAGMGLGMFWPDDAAIIIPNAPKLAESLVKWGDSDPKVYAALERLCTTSAFGAVLAAHAPVILALLANHNVIGKKDAKPDSHNQAGEYPSESPTASEPVARNPDSNMGSTGGLTPVIMEAGGTRIPSRANGVRENHPVTGTT